MRFAIGDPLFDRLPGRFDGLDGLDIEWGRWRARELDDGGFHAAGGSGGDGGGKFGDALAGASQAGRTLRSPIDGPVFGDKTG